ncbi:GAF and ANTAR domain-containing protein [Kutzneria sp. CA-103260]|uniref:GAF and ANTAR domain-containing protein n=1 Tax=Kutzneria sp. CA-103260 TaxID=2802641 RepID=UPI001BA816BC|nr:GAF and ANTAR domain-containing protein [Kutzneria sp. CA-103260]QUQ64101.1 ANTAR domain-containing protein [Kutzneria sp. CA-103260]
MTQAHSPRGPSSARDRRLAATFVELADTLVAGFDIIDMLHTLTERCVELLDVDAAAVLLPDRRRALQLVASTEQSHLIELMRLRNQEGPFLDTYRTGAPAASADLTAEGDRWPQLAAAARQSGYGGVQALPLRLHAESLGVLGLFQGTVGSLPPDTMAIGQSMADIATISILHSGTTRRREQLAEQLNLTLNARITIEQAKGYLAEKLQVGVAEAFAIMRDHAHDSGMPLTDLARAVLTARIDPAELADRT